MNSGELFATLVARSELSGLIAKSCVRQACQRIGVRPESLRVEDLPRVVVELEPGIRTFHEERHADRVVQGLRELVARTADSVSC